MAGITGNIADLLEGPNGIVLDRRSRQVRAGDQEVLLTKQGFDLLALLLENRGDVLTKEYLAQTVWHHDAVSDLHFLHTAIYRLRAALKAADSQSPIVAVRGVGYTIPGAPFGAGTFRPREAFESALQSLIVPTMIIDTTRRIRFANEAFAKLVGYTVEELGALPSAAVLSPGDLQGVRAELTRRVFSGESDRSERVPMECRDGTLIEVPMVAVSPLSIDGEVVGAVIECITSELYHGDRVATPSIANR
jgi:PAS domain S-box-containing protein